MSDAAPLQAWGLVVIPAYGSPALTEQAVRDCYRESDVVDVLVVDNRGDYESVADERVIRPGRNLGWLKGSNAGAQVAVDDAYEAIILLNNDVALSSNFFTGLAEALTKRPEAIVAPCYDDVVVAQSEYFCGKVDEFQPQPAELPARLIDGTCLALRTHTWQLLGPLDARRFGRWGWGAIDDYCLRARVRGVPILVTRRSYLQHARGATAAVVNRHYEGAATAEMQLGMRLNWGPNWRLMFDDGTVGQRERRETFLALRRVFKYKSQEFLRSLRWRRP